MDKSTARELIRLYLKAGEPLNEATEIIDKLPDAEEQKRLRRPIGELISNVYIELIRPIVREYPDLDPDRSA
jgi:hypothetical protein